MSLNQCTSLTSAMLHHAIQLDAAALYQVLAEMELPDNSKCLIIQAARVHSQVLNLA